MNPIFYAVLKAFRGEEAGSRRSSGMSREDEGKAAEWAARGLSVIVLVLVALLIAYFVFGR